MIDLDTLKGASIGDRPVIGIAVGDQQVWPTGHPYDLAVLADSPDHYWKLDETEGTTFADSVGGVPASAVGSVTLGADGPAAGLRALALGGSGRATLPQVVMHGRSTWTVEGWINCASFTSNPTLLGSRSTLGSDRWTAFLRASPAGTLDCIYYNQSNTARDTANDGATLAVNTWGHVAFTYDGSHVRRYLNGVEVGTALAVTGDVVKLSGAAPPESIGAIRTNAGLEQLLVGRIGRVAVYPSALSAGRIAAHHAAMVAG